MRRLPICPPATQDIGLNLRNRLNAIRTAAYGPANPRQPNEAYWQRLADEWGIDVEEAKTMRCGNCLVFNVSPRMQACIAEGIGSEGVDPYDAIYAGGLGYCEAFKFKCAAERTCLAWIVGGPMTK